MLKKVNGDTPARVSRRELGPVVDMLQRHEDAIGHLMASQVQADQWAFATRNTLVTVAGDLTHHLTGLSRWQRLRWLLNL